MSETSSSTRGLLSSTSPTSRVGVRLVSLAIAALIGAVLIVGVSRATWQRVDRLEEQFSALRPESFYVGVRLQSRIRRLNDTLLRYRLRRDESDARAFRAEAQDLRKWFDTKSDEVVPPLERDFLQQISKAYLDYFGDSQRILEAKEGLFQTTAGAFHISYTELEVKSADLLKLCDTFVENQRADFQQFMAESNATLEGFQRMLKVAASLVLGLGAVLVGLVYRDMIAPLRLQLSESQAIIERQEKLASLGVLAAGLAHEIRNPLTAIRFRLFSMRKLLPAGEATEDAAVINNEIGRLERILEDFLRFARPAEPDLVAVPAHRLLQEVHELMRVQVERDGVALNLEAGEPLWVKADTAQMKQVLINLVKNAADSVGHKGAVTLRARSERHGLSSRQPSVALEVSDTGKGIPVEVQKRLFDPFFTTKEGGTGLGLPIAARIVEKHGGAIRYRTQADQGTTFRVLLPEHQS